MGFFSFDYSLFFGFCFYSFFFCVSVWVSFCVLVFLVLLLPFVLGFSLSFLFFFVCLFVGFFFYFSLLSLFFSFFSVLCGLCMLQPGVRPKPPRWETQIEDVGPPENSWAHEILISKSSPKGLPLSKKTWPHPKTRKLQFWTPHTKPSAE